MSSPILHQIHRLIEDPRTREAADEELLRAFHARRDEASFHALLRRHGPMVLDVCRAVLPNEADVEDAFQATFLILARKAGSIRKTASLGSWLHGVAHRTALKARAKCAQRRKHEPRLPPRETSAPDDLSWCEVRRVLHEELDRLAERHRAPLVLCYLQGKTQDEAAALLGLPKGTLKGRLERGRALLRERLIRRGLAPALLLASAWPTATAAVPAALVVSTVAAATLVAARQPLPADVISPRAVTLAQAGGPTANRLLVGMLVGLLGVGLGLTLLGRLPAPAEKEPDRPAVEKQVRTDLHGDPLPAGALARMGTVRFRALEASWLAFAPGDTTLLTAGSQSLSAWDVATGKELRRFHAKGGSGAFALSPDGKTLAAGTYTDNPNVVAIFLHDVATGRTLRELHGHSDWVRSLAFSADGRTLLSGSHDKSARLWDLEMGKELRRFDEPDLILAVALSPDGKTAATTSFRSTDSKWTVRLRDAATGQDQYQFHVDQPVFHLRFSPDGKTLVALEPANGGKPKGTIHLWDAVTGKVRQIPGQPEYTYSAAFSPDSKLLATGSDYGIVLWDVSTAKERGRPIQNSGTSGVAFSGDGKTLASLNQGLIRLWDVATGKERAASADGHLAGVQAVAFLPDGKTLASAGSERALRHWEAATGRPGRHHLLPGASIDKGTVFAPDGSTLAWRAGKRVVQVDATTGKPLRSFDFPEVVYHFALSPDGKLLAASGSDHKPRLVDWAAGKLVRELSRKTEVVSHLAFAADSRTLVVGREEDDGYSFGLLDTTTDQRRVLPRWPGVWTFLFSPDGRTLTASVSDNRLVLIEVATAEERLALPLPEQAAELAYSPDGKLLAVGTANGAIHLWELATGKEVRRFEGHRGGISCLAFSADGRRLASGGHDTTVLTWDVTNLTGTRPAAAPLSPKELEALWTDLAGADAAAAYRAIGSLSAAPAQSLPFLGRHLRPAAAPDPKHLARLIADLDADDFTVRETATRELEKLGSPAGPALRQALTGQPTAEVRRRAEALLRRLEEFHLTPEELRARRAIEVLEQVGTADAREILERLVREGPDTALPALDARAALERLRRRVKPG